MSATEQTNSDIPQPEGPIYKPHGSLTPQEISQSIRERLTAAGAPQQAIDAASDAALTLDSNQSQSASAWFGSVLVYTWLYVQTSSGHKFKGGGGGVNFAPAGVSGGTVYTANGYTLDQLYQLTTFCSWGGVASYFTVEFWTEEGGTLLGSFQGGGFPNLSGGSGEGKWD